MTDIASADQPSFLLLDATQAAALAGPTADGAALMPVPLADGEGFVLPLAVRDDPAHAARHAECAALPVVQVAAASFPVLTAPGG